MKFINSQGKRFFGTLMFLGFLANATDARAGYFDLSFSFGFNRSNYTNVNYSWERHYGVSLGYLFSEMSQIEVGFQDAVSQTHIENYQDTTFHDNIYSMSLVQSLFPKGVPVQPYIKGGVGQVYRTIEGSYSGVDIPTTHVASLTGIVGAGMKIMLSQRMAIKTEATSYLVGGALGTWRDNYALSAGCSFYF